MAKARVKTLVGGGHEEVHVAPLVDRRESAEVRNTGKGRRKKKSTAQQEVDVVWDSGLKVVSPPILIDVPKVIADVIRAIDKKISSNVEFSIYVKADTSDVECVRISEEYYIPKQSVSHSSIDYNDVPGDGFNAVIHKHPSGIRSFSSTDDEFINQNFTVSILWCAGEFVDATVNYDIEAGTKLQLPGYVYVDDAVELPDVDVSNISIYRGNITGGHGMNDLRGHSAIGSYAEQYGYFRNGENDFMRPGEDEEFTLVGKESLNVGMK